MKTSCPLGVVILIFLTATACNPSGTEEIFPPQPTSTTNLTYTPSASPTRTQTPIPTSTPQPTATPCSPNPPSAPPTVTPTHIPNFKVPLLTYAMLQNGTYDTLMSGRITFKNSRYQDEGGYTSLGEIAFGDLNNDGVEDAAVPLGESFTGGSMYGVSFFAVINEKGVPVQTNIIGIGDHTPIYKLSIQRGRIILDTELGQFYERDQYYTPVEMTYQLSGLTLYLSRFTSRSVDWGTRAVQITSPAGGTAVTCSMQVSGTITEFSSNNDLVYTLSDLAGKEFGKGSIPVKNDEAGGPGTFNKTISLRDVPAGTAFHLEITENNLYDYGKEIRARDSVDLMSE